MREYGRNMQRCILAINVRRNWNASVCAHMIMIIMFQSISPRRLRRVGTLQCLQHLPGTDTQTQCGHTDTVVRWRRVATVMQLTAGGQPGNLLMHFVVRNKQEHNQMSFSAAAKSEFQVGFCMPHSRSRRRATGISRFIGFGPAHSGRIALVHADAGQVVVRKHAYTHALYRRVFLCARVLRAALKTRSPGARVRVRVQT